MRIKTVFGNLWKLCWCLTLILSLYYLNNIVQDSDVKDSLMSEKNASLGKYTKEMQSAFIVTKLSRAVLSIGSHTKSTSLFSSTSTLLETTKAMQGIDAHGTDHSPTAMSTRKRGNLFHQLTQSDHHDKVITFMDIAKFDINCSTINELKIFKRIGQGMDKVAFLGEFRGMKVAVKTCKVTDENCIKVFNRHLNDPLLELADALVNDCTNSAMRQFLIEIVYHTVLKSHPQIVRFHGFCLHKVPDAFSEFLSQYYKNSDIPTFLSVTDVGQPLSETKLALMPWQQKLNICKTLAPLLDAMNHTLL